MKYCDYSPSSQIYNASFSLQFKNGSNKLECYVTLSWKGLLVTNTLTYWANGTVMIAAPEYEMVFVVKQFKKPL